MLICFFFISSPFREVKVLKKSSKMGVVSSKKLDIVGALEEVKYSWK